MRDGWLWTGPVDAPFTRRERVPRWLPVGASAADERLGHVGFWVTPELVFVEQFDRTGAIPPACRLLDIGARAWRRSAGGCLSADFSYLAEVTVGPRGLLALHSSGEGAYAVSIVHYDVRRGQSDTAVSSIVLEGASAVHVRFAPDGGSVQFISPCALEGKPPPACEDPQNQEQWRLYSVPTSGGALRLVRADLPAGAAFDPAHDRFAWPKGDAVCWGEPREASPKCASKP
jgi:hypothetical protein